MISKLIIKRYIIISTLVLLIFCFSTSSYGKNISKRNSISLTGTSIDLLVGTPSGIEEPLDKRRISKEEHTDVDLDIFLSEWEKLPDSGNIAWNNAEENKSQVSADKIESEYLDLIADIDMDNYEQEKPLENKTASSTFKQNMSNSVATNKKL